MRRIVHTPTCASPRPVHLSFPLPEPQLQGCFGVASIDASLQPLLFSVHANPVWVQVCRAPAQAQAQDLQLPIRTCFHPKVCLDLLPRTDHVEPLEATSTPSAADPCLPDLSLILSHPFCFFRSFTVFSNKTITTYIYTVAIRPVATPSPQSLETDLAVRHHGDRNRNPDTDARRPLALAS